MSEFPELELDKEDKPPQECPYRRACSGCPGDDPERGLWEPSLGFRLLEDGILCLDWDKKIPTADLPKVKLGEGRHITDYIAASERLDEAKKRYAKSDKGREARERYQNSEAGRAARAKFQQTEKHALALKKYYYSDKGQRAHAKRRVVVQDFRAAKNWLKDNPGKTYQDYLNAQANE